MDIQLNDDATMTAEELYDFLGTKSVSFKNYREAGYLNGIGVTVGEGKATRHTYTQQEAKAIRAARAEWYSLPTQREIFDKHLGPLRKQ